MMTPLQTTKMDIGKKTRIFVYLVFYINCVSGGEVPQPENLEVDVEEGNVVVLWNKPAEAPSNSRYNVQMANYSGEWTAVHSCTGITYTKCDIGSLIYDYRTAYKVKVQLVAGDAVSAWTIKRKLVLNTSKQLPPSFTLRATSSTLAVKIDWKPILRKKFPYGVTYTIYLEDREQNKTTTAYLLDDMEEDQKTKTFGSLQWGREYCVSIKVQGKGAIHESNMSPEKCLQLPEQELLIFSMASLSILGVLAFIAILVIILLCYLKRPEKTPVALKSPKSGWLPLSIGEGTMEVVTDKGWFLSSYRTEVKKCIKDPLTHIIVTEDNGEEDRRTSMDSGVSMEVNSTTKSGGSPPRQEDSGCGSLGGPESSTSSQTDYPLQEERTELDVVRKREDSGVGMGFQLHSSSLNLDGRDSESLKEVVAGGDYRRQSPSSVQIHACGDEEAFKQMLPDSVLADVVTGYRAGPQSCICSGAGQCSWCHKQGVYGTGHIKEYRATCIDNGLLSGKCDFVDSYKGGLTFSSYCKKTQMDTVTVDDIETTFIQLGENFPLLTALTPSCLIEDGKDFNMNNVSLSLCDVQLTSE